MIKLKQGQITELTMNTIQNIGDSFLYYNYALNSLSLPNVYSRGNGFLYRNYNRKSIIESLHTLID